MTTTTDTQPAPIADAIRIVRTTLKTAGWRVAVQGGQVLDARRSGATIDKVEVTLWGSGILVTRAVFSPSTGASLRNEEHEVPLTDAGLKALRLLVEDWA